MSEGILISAGCNKILFLLSHILEIMFNSFFVCFVNVGNFSCHKFDSNMKSDQSAHLCRLVRIFVVCIQYERIQRNLQSNPLYTGRLFDCYMLDKSICYFRGVGSILLL